ncbi:MAG: non-canonical purine NTP pyrophosphatase, partial [Fenollaria timonensis]
MKKVIVSTNNENKLKEIKLIFHELGYEVLSKKEAGIADFDVDETGTTLEENAYIKA